MVSADGIVVFQHRQPTPVTHNGEELFEFLLSLVDEVRIAASAEGIDFSSLLACGVGCGGPMTQTAVSPLNIQAWRDFPLLARLQKELSMPIVVDNDAKALASGEGRWGAARGLRNFLAMVVSTGIGGGLVLDGRLINGESGNAGHIGHVIVEPNGQLCECGARGCVEAEVSGTAIEKLFGSPADAPLEWRQRTGMLVGRAIANVVSLCDVQHVFIAGSVAFGFGDDFLQAARQEVAARSQLSFAQNCEVEFAGLGPQSPLLGAASLGFSLMEK